jgi:hypothetical protein
MKFLRGPIAAVCAAGCVLIPVASAKESALAANTVSGVQIGLGSCVSLDTQAARNLPAVVFTGLVSEGLNLLGTALSQAGSDMTWTAQGARNLPAHADAAFPKCVQVVRGRFRTDTRRAAGDALKGLSLPEDALGAFEANGIWLADRPDFVFEGRIVMSEERTAAAIRPLYAVMSRPIEDRAFGKGGKERSVVAFLAFSTPGHMPTLETNPAATVVLGPMKPGQAFKFPPGSDNNKYVSTTYDTPWFTLAKADAEGPLTVTAMVAETQPGNEFAKFLATILNRPDVKSEITQAVTQQAN